MALADEDAMEQSGPPAEQSGEAAAEVCADAELPHDGRAVPEDVLRRDDTADRHCATFPTAHMRFACPRAMEGFTEDARAP